MNKQNLKFVYTYTRPYLKLWILGVILTVTSIVLEIRYSWLIRNLIDDALIPKNLKLLVKLCITYFILVIFCSILSFIKELCFNYVSQKSIANMRIDLFDHIIRLPYDFFVKTDNGDIINRLVNDAQNTQDAFSDHIVSLITSFLTTIFIAVWLVIVNWKLALLFFIIVPLFCGITQIMWNKISRLSKKVSEDTGYLTSFLQEAIYSIEIVKISGSEYFTKKLETICKKLANTSVKLRMSNVFSNSLWTLILTPYQGVFYLIGGCWYIKYNEPSIGTMLVFVNLVGLLIPNVLTLISSISYMATGIASLQRMKEIFDSPIEQGGEKLLSSEEDIFIEFNNVCYKYEDTGFAIKNISFTVSNEDFVTIIGHTGSGKSTLLKLLCRLHDIDSGDIKINGVNIKEYDLADLRRCMGILQQDIYLIKGTIRENLLITNAYATEAQINEVIHIAQLKQFIDSLPNKLDTIIGERGITLSGGEKQRLSLARMLLSSSPKIIFMDEPTAALDIKTEKQLYDDMKDIFLKNAIIVIDHRLATLHLASKILVMEKGAIIEEGSYEEVITRNRNLSQLLRSQK